jgi:hypothetical protein
MSGQQGAAGSLEKLLQQHDRVQQRTIVMA